MAQLSAYATIAMPAPLSIYIHIPFCGARCSYCAFNTYTELAHLMPAYVDAVCKELAFEAIDRPPARTVYFGGGTPSLLTAAQFEQVMRQLHDSFALTDDAEISLEANPDDLPAAYLRDLRSLGFNRISIGMQSANARVLRLFERTHDLSAVGEALRNARQAGFDNLNLDVIFGSPYETLADWQGTIAALLSFAPDHISMYGLELKGGTSLRQLVDAGALPQPDEDLFADMYEFAAEALDRGGYAQYEISNWRKPGHECRHNLQYWRNLDYLGIGAGAHGFAAGTRYSTIAAPGRYIAALENADFDKRPFPLTPAVAKRTRVTVEDDLYETLMMGLRMTEEGLCRASFRRRFGMDIVAMFTRQCEKLRDIGLLEVSEDRVRLTPAARLLSNFVIRAFVEAIPEAAAPPAEAL